MPVRERPAEYAILGLLHLDERGGHGYDLARHFGPDQPLGDVLHLEPGMLYHHLKRLERAGLVTSATAQEGARPPKQIYQITEQGREALARWLQSPVGHTREIRLDFLVKLYFARHFDPDVAARLIETQLEMLRQLHDSLLEQRAGQPVPHGDRAFLGEVVALRLAQTGAAIDWLESLRTHRGDRDASRRRMP